MSRAKSSLSSLGSFTDDKIEMMILVKTILQNKRRKDFAVDCGKEI